MNETNSQILSGSFCAIKAKKIMNIRSNQGELWINKRRKIAKCSENERAEQTNSTDTHTHTHSSVLINKDFWQKLYANGQKKSETEMK